MHTVRTYTHTHTHTHTQNFKERKCRIALQCTVSFVVHQLVYSFTRPLARNGKSIFIIQSFQL
jgi:hypothetical protein